ncbi:hypothetical protein, partial [Eggerthella lenta]|uniref:hypothetical protein n=1 Tax=Eggerthella lenta TaxID=84112 RepID=UPI00210EBEFF
GEKHVRRQEQQHERGRDVVHPEHDVHEAVGQREHHENEPEGMAAKSERQIDWEMGIVGMASSRRREEAVKSWWRSPGAAERENGGFLVALGLSNAERSAANEAMIAEIPEVAFF